MVRLDGPGLSVAGSADLLGQPRDGQPGTLEPYEIGTVRLTPVPASAAPSETVEIGPRIQPVQPVYARYWLHNKGPAPMGNQPVSVHLHRGDGHDWRDGRDGAVEVTVASDLTSTTYEGTVWITAPPGWTADPFERPVRLAPGGWTRFTVDLGAGPDAAGGVLAARLDYAGGTVEDVLPLGDDPGAVVATLPADELRLRPGQRGTLTVRLENTAGYAVRGEVQAISPWGTWEMVSPSVQGFELGAGGQADVRIDVAVPEGTADGHWWALAKVMWFGRVAYTAAVRIVVAA
jgi:hypothetical protein